MKIVPGHLRKYKRIPTEFLWYRNFYRNFYGDTWTKSCHVEESRKVCCKSAATASSLLE